MIHIAICDDEKVETDYLTSLVTTWGADNGHSVSITTFANAKAFLFAYPDMKKLDILLLDIQMGENAMDGMGVAKEIRKTNQDVHIIFITGFPDYMSEGYDVAALHYLMKPIKEPQFFALLNKAASTLDIKEAELVVQAPQGTTRIRHKDIIYIEAFAHYVQINTTTQVVETRANIGDLAAQLGANFGRCHRSYVIGYKHVNQITKTDILLDNGASIPLSRRMAKDINQGFIAHYKGDM